MEYQQEIFPQIFRLATPLPVPLSSAWLKLPFDCNRGNRVATTSRETQQKKNNYVQ